MTDTLNGHSKKEEKLLFAVKHGRTTKLLYFVGFQEPMFLYVNVLFVCM
jgi:hypothetical protein